MVWAGKWIIILFNHLILNRFFGFFFWLLLSLKQPICTAWPKKTPYSTRQGAAKWCHQRGHGWWWWPWPTPPDLVGYRRYPQVSSKVLGNSFEIWVSIGKPSNWIRFFHWHAWWLEGTGDTSHFCFVKKLKFVNYLRYLRHLYAPLLVEGLEDRGKVIVGTSLSELPTAGEADWGEAGTHPFHWLVMLMLIDPGWRLLAFLFPWQDWENSNRRLDYPIRSCWFATLAFMRGITGQAVLPLIDVWSKCQLIIFVQSPQSLPPER